MTARRMSPPPEDNRYLINVGTDLLPQRSWTGFRTGGVRDTETRLTDTQFNALPDKGND